MKLTKAQRLFIAAGEIQHEIRLLNNSFAPWDEDRAESSKAIKQYKARRKKLIKKALLAWEDEKADNCKKEAEAAYHRGHKVGFDAGFSAFMF